MGLRTQDSEGSWIGLELLPQGAWCLPEDVAVLSLCACPVAGVVAILTYLVVATGSEIVAGWEGVMSTSPLSDTFSGNLAGAASFGGLGRGTVRWSHGLGWGMGSLGTRSAAAASCLHSPARSHQKWDFQGNIFPCGHQDPQVVLSFPPNPNDKTQARSFSFPRRQCVGFPGEFVGRGFLWEKSTVP